MVIYKNNTSYNYEVKNGVTYNKSIKVQPYFSIENLTNSTNTITIKKDENWGNSAPTINVYKSTDQINWTSMGSTSTTGITATIPANGKLYLKATANKWAYYDSVHDSFSYNYIGASGNYKVSGNIMSLLLGDNFNNETLTLNNEYAFGGLFNTMDGDLNRNLFLIDSSKLILPSNTVTGCFKKMFYRCRNLITTPALPATTLANSCYQGMFQGCTSLTTAPALPVTTLAQTCYASMFQGCTSLATAPTLPATILTSGCYSYMFSGCTNLNTVITYANDISATSCLNYWLDSVSVTGEFYNLGNPAPTYPSGVSGIPSGWTEHNSL